MDIDDIPFIIGILLLLLVGLATFSSQEDRCEICKICTKHFVEVRDNKVQTCEDPCLIYDIKLKGMNNERI